MSLEVEKPVLVPATVPVVALDGPTASGKGTVASRLAALLGFHVLDSGLLYRVLALAAEHHGVGLENEDALEVLAGHLDVQFDCDGRGDSRVILEGEDVSLALRQETVGRAASLVAALRRVRSALLNRQRAFRELPGLVADGRDMGTVVFPDACLKVYMTASVEARAGRRYRQLLEKGFDASLADLTQDIRNRDMRDMTRTVAPLKPAEDANHIDTTDMGVDEVVERILIWMRQQPELAAFAHQAQ